MLRVYKPNMLLIKTKYDKGEILLGKMACLGFQNKVNFGLLLLISTGCKQELDIDTRLSLKVTRKSL